MSDEDNMDPYTEQAKGLKETKNTKKERGSFTLKILLPNGKTLNVPSKDGDKVSKIKDTLASLHSIVKPILCHKYTLLSDDTLVDEIDFIEDPYIRVIASGTTEKADMVKAYEEYLLSDNNIQKALAVVPEKSLEYYYLQFLDKLNKGESLNSDQRKYLAEWVKTKSPLAYKINARMLLRDYDLAKDEAGKKKILAAINDVILKNEFNDKKPPEIDLMNASITSSQTTYTSVCPEDPSISQLSKAVVLNIKEYIRDYTTLLYPLIDLTLLDNKRFMEIINTVGNFTGFNVEKISAKLTNVKELDSNFIKTLTQKCTTHQLTILAQNDLFKNNSIFIICLWSKKYKLFGNLNGETEESKLDTLSKLINEMKAISEFKRFLPYVCLKKLEMQSKMNLYDLHAFQEYLKMKKDTKATSKKIIAFLSSLGFYEPNIFERESTIIEKFAFYMLDSNVKLEDYWTVQTEYLNIVKEKWNYMRGNKVNSEIAFSSFYMQERDKLLLKIDESSKDKFSVFEEVSVTLETQNIDEIKVCIYVQNEMKYYQENEEEIPNFDMEGILPTYEKVISGLSINQHRVCKHRIPIPQISKVPGLYIVDFISKDKRSRAIIKIGFLSYLEKTTPSCQEFYILDEANTICKGKKTGLWMYGMFYPADQEGKICLNFQTGDWDQPAILVHEDICQTVYIHRISDTFKLDFSMLYTPETILAGKMAKLLIFPQLLLDNISMPLSLLQFIEVEVTMSEYIGNTKTPKIYQCEITDNKYIQLNLQIPYNLSDISIVLSCKVNGKPKTAQQNISITSYCNEFSNAEIFLQMIENSYQLIILGKNAEPIANQLVTIRRITNYSYKRFDHECYTDRNGIIKLGTLVGVTEINAITQLQSTQLNKTWRINDESQFIYPQQIDILEGEELVLPYSSKALPTPPHLIVTDKFNASEIMNIIEPVPHLNKDMLYDTFKISGLTKGNYVLKVQGNEVRINVMTGEKIANNAILSGKYLYENIKSVEFPTVKSCLIDKESLKIDIDSVHKECNLFVMMTQFVPSDSEIYQYNMTKINTTYYPLISKIRNPWKNKYMAEAKISNEMRYIMDKRNVTQQISSHLQKPTLLTAKELSQKYDASTMPHVQDSQYAEISYDIKECIPQYIQDREKSLDKNYPSISSVVNFLQNDGLITTLKIPNSGLYTLPLPVSMYNCIIIILVGDNYSHMVTKYTGFNNVISRDLAVASPLDSSKNYIETKSTIILKEGDEVKLDAQSSTYQIIDSLESAYAILTELNKSHLSKSEGVAINKFGYLYEWNLKTEEEKLNLFNEQISHELNLFLKYKDPAFFELHVRPYLANKMDKSFLDEYLIGEFVNIQKYNNNDSLSKMNWLEKLLYIESLMKTDEVSAKRIATFLLDTAEMMKNPESGNLFDKVMQMNLTKLKKEVVEKNQTDVNTNTIDFLNIKTTTGFILTLRKIRSSMTVGELKKKIEEITGILIRNQRLIYNGTPLSDYATLATAKVKNESTIHLNKGGSGGDGKGESAPVPMNNLKTESVSANSYCERYYLWNTTNANYNILILYSPFLIDVLKNIISGKKPTLISGNFTSCYYNATEMAMALTLLDLPFKSKEHSLSAVEDNLIIKAKSPMIIMKKELMETTFTPRKDILVLHKYNKRRVNYEEVEFLVNQVYECHLIITNLSDEPIDIQYLFQIPQGAIPVNRTPYKKLFYIKIQSFNTAKSVFTFYFPKPGAFKHYGTSVSIGNQVIAKGKENTLNVVKYKQIINEKNFFDILCTLNIPQILSFIKNNNILDDETGFQMDYILWMLKDKDFYLKIIPILKEKGIYNSFVWAYSMYHGDEPSLKEYLGNSKLLRKILGRSFTCTLFKIEPTEYDFIHLEFFPYINPRAALFGGKKKEEVLNKHLEAAYQDFLEYLFEKNAMNDYDKLKLCYYLILLEKYTIAEKFFSTIKRDSITSKLQYDYMYCYLQFIQSPKLSEVRAISEKYLKTGVSYWDLLFHQMILLVEDIEKKKIDIGKVETKAIEEEKKLSSKIIGNKIEIIYQGIRQVELKYFIIDMEVVFSKSPFNMWSITGNSFLLPYKKMGYDLDPNKSAFEINIPEEFLTQSVILKIESYPLECNHTLFNNKLKVVNKKEEGDLYVANEMGEPLSGIYAKVYITNYIGEVMYYKDGYTDISGKFNYSRVSHAFNEKKKQYSILVFSPLFGSQNLLFDGN